MLTALYIPPTQPASRFAGAAPWISSVALHVGVALGLAFFYRASLPTQPPRLELIALPSTAPPAPTASTPPPARAAAPSTAAPRPAAPLLTAAAPAEPATAMAQPLLTPPQTTAQSPAPLPSALATKPSPAAPATPAAAPVIKTAARFDAAYLQNPAPPYPVQSRRLNEAGTVQLLVKVNSQGMVEALSLHRSSGFARLDEAAKLAVQAWRFVPARLGDAPAADVVIVPIVFKD